VSTKVSIGYDTPWREVHRLLLAAAKATAGVRATPET
jgi:small-conductance mechanosensitive channel